MLGKYSTNSATSPPYQFIYLFLIMYIFAVLGWDPGTPKHAVYY